MMLRTTLMALSLVAVACGQNEDEKSVEAKKSPSTKKEELNHDKDCDPDSITIQLSADQTWDATSHPGQHPGQNPGQTKRQPPKKQPPKKEPPKSEPPKKEPPKKEPPKSEPPKKEPPKGKNPCDDKDTPVQQPPKKDPPKYDPKKDNGTDTIGTEPFPVQTKYNPSQCGKNGKLCYDKGKIQWPGQSVDGHGYSRKDVEQCLDAFAGRGVQIDGTWGIQSKSYKKNSFFSYDLIEDYGHEPTVVMIRTNGVLGKIDMNLLNPNALYCIKNVSVLANLEVNSCHNGNVVALRDINVFSSVHSHAVNCQ